MAAWGSDAARLAALLLAPFADTRELAAELAADALAGADVGLRRALLDRLLDVLGGPEPEPGRTARPSG